MLGLALHIALIAVFAVRALWRDDLSTAARLAWFVVLIALPGVGIVIYLLFGEIKLERRILRRRDAIIEMIRADARAVLGSCDANLDDVALARQYHPAFRLAAAVAGFGTTAGNRATLMAGARAAREQLLDDIDQSTDHVHVLYYIWLDDETGTNVAQALIRAVHRGVRCRAMVDGLGSRALLRSPLWQAMRAAGVELAVAMPIDNVLRTFIFGRLDLRNHRKITVIDGRIGYCGSQNCADPEFRVKAKFAPWVDLMVRFEGPVVAQLQMLFASDWIMHTSDGSLASFPFHTNTIANGFLAQVFGSGPSERPGATPQLLATLIAQAQDTLVVTTPYFVPNPTVLDALCAAARRGVQVTMIFPARNDSWVVAAASRSFYRRLLDSGIAIHEFDEGLLHTKSLTIDGVMAFIGSTNMDLRSFDLNFENDVLLNDAALTRAITQRQHAYLRQSQPVTLDDVMAWSPLRRLWNNLIATAGPIL